MTDVGTDEAAELTTEERADDLPIYSYDGQEHFYRFRFTPQNTQSAGPTYTAAISPTAKTFDAATYGYAAQGAQVFTITNTGTGTLTGLAAALTGGADLKFEISEPLTGNTLAPGGTATVGVRPKAGLAAGTHTGALAVTGGNGLSLSANLSFTVNRKAVTVTGVTATKEYDGTPGFTTDQIDVSKAAFDGKLSADSLALGKAGVTGALPTADAGAAGALTLSGRFTLGGAAAGNYTLAQQPTVTASITKATGGLAAPDAKIYIKEGSDTAGTYDLTLLAPVAAKGTAGSVTYALYDTTSAGALNADPTLSDTTLAYKPDPSGVSGATYTQKIKITTTNYADIEVSVVFAVTDKEPVSIEGISLPAKTYDGTPIAPQGEAIVTKIDDDEAVTPGKDLIYAYTGTAADGTAYDSANPPTKAGTYNLKIAADAADSVIGETNIAFIIGKAVLTIKADDKSIRVNAALPAFTYSVTGLAEGDAKAEVLTTEPAVESPTADAGKAGTYPIAVYGAALTAGANAKGANYEIAYANGIVGGYSADIFGANDPVTREQIAVLLYRYAKLMDLDVSAAADLSAYADADGISEWAREAMAWANAAGLITGRDAGTLAPADDATRAEVAAILHRFAESVQ